MQTLNRISPKNRVIDYITEAVDKGTLKPGDFLYSERELCEELHVARGTVRSALDELTRIGLTESRKGCKRRIAVPRKKSSNPLLHETFAIFTEKAELLERLRGTVHEDSLVQELLSAKLEESGFHVIRLNPEKILSSRSPESLLEGLRGIVLTSLHIYMFPRLLSVINTIHSRGISVYFYGQADQVCNLELNSVYADHYTGGKKLVDYAIKSGNPNCATLWISPLAEEKAPWLVERSEGITDALKEYNSELLFNLELSLEEIGKSYETVHFEKLSAIIRKHLEKAIAENGLPDILFTSSDEAAFLAIRALKKSGYTPGKDILVSGYDNRVNSTCFSFKETGKPDVTADKHLRTIAEKLGAVILKETQTVRQKRKINRTGIAPTLVFP